MELWQEISENLSDLGKIDDPDSYFLRRIILEFFLLTSDKAGVRHAALMGLAYMADTNSLPSINKALAKEQIFSLREDILQVQQLITRQGINT